MEVTSSGTLCKGVDNIKHMSFIMAVQLCTNDTTGDHTEIICISTR